MKLESRTGIDLIRVSGTRRAARAARRRAESPASGGAARGVIPRSDVAIVGGDTGAVVRACRVQEPIEIGRCRRRPAARDEERRAQGDGERSACRKECRTERG